MVNILILITGDERAQRLCRTSLGLDLDRNERGCRADKEILLERGILALVVIQLIPGLDERFTDYILIQRTLVHAEVFVGAQVLLRLLIEHGNEQAAVRKIQLVLCLIIIALERQFREIQAVADVDHAGIVQPFNAAAVIAETRTGRDLGNLEFLVVLGKLHRDVLKHVQNAGLVQAVRVFADVLPVVRDKLALGFE